MRNSRAFLVLLIAAVLLGAAGAEAARALPTPASLSPALDPPNVSLSELLDAPWTEAAGTHPYRLETAEDLSLLIAYLGLSTAEASDMLGGDGYRLFLALRADLAPAAPVFILKLASGHFDLLFAGNVWETGDLAGKSHRPTFQGLWTDPTSGLAYARARWYDPRNASWLSEDPMGDVDSPNLYSAFAYRPQFLNDPYGEGVCDWFGNATCGDIFGDFFTSIFGEEPISERRVGFSTSIWGQNFISVDMPFTWGDAAIFAREQGTQYIAEELSPLGVINGVSTAATGYTYVVGTEEECNPGSLCGHWEEFDGGWALRGLALLGAAPGWPSMSAADEVADGLRLAGNTLDSTGDAARTLDDLPATPGRHLDEGVENTLDMQRALARLTHETRDAFIDDPNLLMRYLEPGEIDAIIKEPWRMRLFFGTALERRVAALAEGNDLLSTLRHTAPNAPQDFITPNGFNYDVTGGSRRSIVDHFNREGIDSVVAYESIPDDFGYDWVKWFNEL